MITLYRHKTGRTSEEIEEKLQDLVLAYETKTLSDSDGEPFIMDGNQRIEGDGNVEAWFRQLESELEWQRSLSGDGCYIDPESGEIC